MYIFDVKSIIKFSSPSSDKVLSRESSLVEFKETFNWASKSSYTKSIYINRRDRSRKMIAEAKATGDPEKIHDKYEKWLDKNEEEIRKMEDKAKTLDTKIKEDLEKRNVDLEFLGKWDRDEN